MTTYSKTVYIEVEADDEDDAETRVAGALDNLVSSDSEITNVDLDGPIEEVADPVTGAGNCKHCGRWIVQQGDTWVDQNATGDDRVWRETCDAHDTFQAEHEPEEGER